MSTKDIIGIATSPSPPPSPPPQILHIYIDNSNLFIEGQKTSAGLRGLDSEVDYAFRIDTAKLVDVLVARATGGAAPPKSSGVPPPKVYINVYGSEPNLPSIWGRLEEENIHVEPYISPRSDGGKEKCVDTALVADTVDQACIDFHTNSNTMDIRSDTRAKSKYIIVSGDKDISPAVGKIVKYGMPVSVWGWRRGMTDVYTIDEKFRDVVKVHQLDNYIQDFSYISTNPPSSPPPKRRRLDTGEAIATSPTPTAHNRTPSSPHQNLCIWRRYCRKGPQCTYPHTAAERAAFASPGWRPLNMRKSMLCSNEPCWRGVEECHFAHGEGDLFCPTCEGRGHAMGECVG